MTGTLPGSESMVWFPAKFTAVKQRRGGWYYLLTAEGGTGWGHCITVARSESPPRDRSRPVRTIRFSPTVTFPITPSATPDTANPPPPLRNFHGWN